ncbi:FMN-dependent NADH-azoreductase [Flavivirga rizhaonensis]|uniref:FMN dependent NADH:quinone oxidoreductase n=1 Tax=Flavivirga rizhaonensis TaxID=2559571 RepID=A0A4S1DYC9_9FLAO|nr:NAD(P)H-dependent oxidoreductase [Flavivirga rizhaonensis]TGV02975.1 FMN-dependent NADH-azoreductase [Flavivirga rizhaonensis]
MKTLLRIDCSSRTKGSHSRTLADYFEENWKAANPKSTIIYRDLAKHVLPHIQNNTIEGFYTPIEHMSPQIKEATALSDELIDELKSVDDILISSPLYNLNIPSNLKAYLDQVVRIGHTFNINEKGYYGLLEGKLAYLITVKGGVYKGTFMEPYDFQEPYLKAILGHMGIKIQELFSLEGSADQQTLKQNKVMVESTIDQSFNELV